MDKQTHINVLESTKKKLSILASVKGTFGYEMTEALVDQAWEKAKRDGLVTDAMIESPTQTKSKKNAAESLAA